MIFKEEDIINEYLSTNKTIRCIAGDFGTNNHLVKRILLRHGIDVSQKELGSQFHRKLLRDR